MTNLSWNDRQLEDQIREIIILLFLLLLLYRAHVHYSFVIAAWSIIAFLQHISFSAYQIDLLSSEQVAASCWILALAGFYHADLLVSFSGVFAIASKVHVKQVEGWPVENEFVNQVLITVPIWALMTSILRFLWPQVVSARQKWRTSNYKPIDTHALTEITEV